MTEESTALALRAGGGGGIELHTVSDLQSFGTILARSGFFKDARDPAKAAVVVLAGRELGLSPVYSLMNIDLIEGRLTVRGVALAGIIRKSQRYDYDVLRCDNGGAELAFVRVEWDVWLAQGAPRGTKPERVPLGTVTFTLEDAKKAGLAGKPNYQRFPADMCLWRAMSRGAKRFCPDLFQGAVYVEGELEQDERPCEREATTVEAHVVASTVTAPSVVRETVEASFAKVGLHEASLLCERAGDDATATSSPAQDAAVTATPPPESVQQALVGEAETPAATAAAAAVETAAAAAAAVAAVVSATPFDDLAILAQTFPQALAQRVANLPLDAPLALEDLRTAHAALVQEMGDRGARAAWQSAGVEVKKGAIVTRKQVLALASYLAV